MKTKPPNPLAPYINVWACSAEIRKSPKILGLDISFHHASVLIGVGGGKLLFKVTWCMFNSLCLGSWDKNIAIIAQARKNHFIFVSEEPFSLLYKIYMKWSRKQHSYRQCFNSTGSGFRQEFQLRKYIEGEMYPKIVEGQKEVIRIFFLKVITPNQTSGEKSFILQHSLHCTLSPVHASQ